MHNVLSYLQYQEENVSLFVVQVARLDFIASDKVEEKWDKLSTRLKVYDGTEITTGLYTSKNP